MSMHPAVKSALFSTLRGMAIGAVIALFILWVSPAEAHHKDWLLAPSAVCGNPTQHAPRDVQLASMLCYHNEARRRSAAAQGIAPRLLRPNAQLAQAADLRARDMIVCRSRSATVCGRGPYYWPNRTGYVNPKCDTVFVSAWAVWDGGRAAARPTMSNFLHKDGTRGNLLFRRSRDFGWGLRRTAEWNGLPDVSAWSMFAGHYENCR